MFRSIRTILRDLKLNLAKVSRTLHGTQYTHHNLKHMLPQHCITYKDVLSLIFSTKA
jgi:hypothetical protein